MSGVAGPDFPNGDSAGDNYAVLLTSGNVLVEGNSGRFYEFNGSTFTGTLFSNGGSLIVLPTGEMLVGGSEVYNSTGTSSHRGSRHYFGSVHSHAGPELPDLRPAVQWLVAGYFVW